jgi:hypothetical protein
MTNEETGDKKDNQKDEVPRMRSKGEVDSFRKEILGIEKERQKLEAKLKSMTQSRDDWERFYHEMKWKRTKAGRLSMEAWTNSLMRVVVVVTFAVIGPLLLITYALGLNVELLLDIFKIWLGAAIGISTNLLQRERPELKAEDENDLPPLTPPTEEPIEEIK